MAYYGGVLKMVYPQVTIGFSTKSWSSPAAAIALSRQDAFRGLGFVHALADYFQAVQWMQSLSRISGCMRLPSGKLT